MHTCLARIQAICLLSSKASLAQLVAYALCERTLYGHGLEPHRRGAIAMCKNSYLSVAIRVGLSIHGEHPLDTTSQSAIHHASYRSLVGSIIEQAVLQ